MGGTGTWAATKGMVSFLIKPISQTGLLLPFALATSRGLSPLLLVLWKVGVQGAGLCQAKPELIRLREGSWSRH